MLICMKSNRRHGESPDSRSSAFILEATDARLLILVKLASSSSTSVTAPVTLYSRFVVSSRTICRRLRFTYPGFRRALRVHDTVFGVATWALTAADGSVFAIVARAATVKAVTMHTLPWMLASLISMIKHQKMGKEGM